MTENPPIAISDYTADGLRRAFKFSARQWVEREAVRFVFKHYAGDKGVAEGRAQRLRLASAFSKEHFKLAYGLCRANEDTFLKGSDKKKRNALYLAVICGDEILKDIQDKDFLLSGAKMKNVRKLIEDARRIQFEAYHLRVSSDLDCKPRRGEPVPSISREGAFLAHINLYTKMCVLAKETDFNTLSDHLRYDLICAPRYLSRNKNWGKWGRVIAQEMDMWEDRILDILKKGSPIINLALAEPERALPPDVIAFPQPRR